MNLCRWDNNFFACTTIFTSVASKIRKLADFTNNKEQNETLNEVLFYGAEDEEQRKQLGLNNLYCIYYVLVHTSSSIDICVPSLTSDTITECLINVRNKNHIRVRLALHSDHNTESLCDLIECGIEVKVINSKVQLEHEFILIDAVNKCEDAVAIIGSLDYEIARVNCNRDNTLLTSEMAVILMLKREFNRVWSSPDSIEINNVTIDDEE